MQKRNSRIKRLETNPFEGLQRKFRGWSPQANLTITNSTAVTQWNLILYQVAFAQFLKVFFEQ